LQMEIKIRESVTSELKTLSWLNAATILIHLKPYPTTALSVHALYGNCWNISALTQLQLWRMVQSEVSPEIA
jgi:hypothetical protein